MPVLCLYTHVYGNCVLSLEIPEPTASNRLTSTQIRGARAMLGWSMVALAKAARVSISTLKRVEDEGPRPVSDAILAMVRDTLETEGVRFLADDGNGLGVRLRTARSAGPRA